MKLDHRRIRSQRHQTGFPTNKAAGPEPRRLVIRTSVGYRTTMHNATSISNRSAGNRRGPERPIEGTRRAAREEPAFRHPMNPSPYATAFGCWGNARASERPLAGTRRLQPCWRPRLSQLDDESEALHHQQSGSPGYKRVRKSALPLSYTTLAARGGTRTRDLFVNSEVSALYATGDKLLPAGEQATSATRRTGICSTQLSYDGLALAGGIRTHDTMYPTSTPPTGSSRKRRGRTHRWSSCVMQQQ